MSLKNFYSNLFSSVLVLTLMAMLALGTSSASFQDLRRNEDGWKKSSISNYPFASNSILEESVEIPSFEIDPKILGSFHSHWIPSHLDTRSSHTLSTAFKKSLPLFDVKTTFLHFFYTW
ncbi:hypothetical protein V8V91_03230 [Algoriphagus halophilus]|uniref:hypothetical protein n=1 Tax=Algoriphagus halophilus TaxID=226505 RepID=UPI00358F3434